MPTFSSKTALLMLNCWRSCITKERFQIGKAFADSDCKGISIFLFLGYFFKKKTAQLSNISKLFLYIVRIFHLAEGGIAHAVFLRNCNIFVEHTHRPPQTGA